MSSRNQKVGARIKRLRLQQGLSQKEVAEPVLTAAYLSLIESGQRGPSEQTIRHISARLGVEPDELLLGRPSGLELRLELSLQEARGDAHRGEVTVASETIDEVITMAKRYQLPRLQARGLCVAASLRERAGDLPGARDLYDEALALLVDAPAHLRFEAVVGSARCTQFIEQDGAKVAIYQLQNYLLELDRTGLPDPSARMRVLSSLVHLYRATGHEQQAIAAAEEAQSLGNEVDDPEQVACMNMNVARALVEQGSYDDALGALRNAERIYQSLDWPLPGARSKINRGIVEVEKGRLETARETFLDALEILGSYPTETADRAAVLDQLGRVERMLGRVDEAVVHLKQARKIIPQDDVFERAFNSREMGLALERSDPSASERELRKAADLFKAAGSPREVARALLELGRILRDSGKLEKANEVLLEGLELNAGSGA